jgi:hypothetical protein
MGEGLAALALETWLIVWTEIYVKRSRVEELERFEGEEGIKDEMRMRLSSLKGERR